MKIKLNNITTDITEEQRQELLAQLKVGEKVKIIPEYGEKYYYINNVNIDDRKLNTYYDISIWNSGNGFWDRETAEKELAKRQAIQRVKDYIKLNGIYFEPDWEDEDEEKNTLYYNYIDNQIYTQSNCSCKNYSPIGYLKSEEDCKKLIENNSEDLLLIYK